MVSPQILGRYGLVFAFQILSKRKQASNGKKMVAFETSQRAMGKEANHLLFFSSSFSTMQVSTSFCELVNPCAMHYRLHGELLGLFKVRVTTTLNRH
jgi:hypothetical protein